MRRQRRERLEKEELITVHIQGLACAFLAGIKRERKESRIILNIG